MRRALLLFGALLVAACASRQPPDDLDLDFEDEQPLTSVGYVDLDRYIGRWYMIANIPYFAESGNLAPFVDYSWRTDGLIDDRYTARDAFDKPPFVKNGVIEVTNRMTNAEGRITFLGPLWQDYAVLYLDKDYKYTAIGHPSRDYCWLFAREPQVPEEIYQDMLASIGRNGFDTKRILKIPHRPEDLGQPGYQ